jgi:hypothetical protein
MAHCFSVVYLTTLSVAHYVAFGLLDDIEK